MDKYLHIDKIRNNLGITLEEVSSYNYKNNTEINNIKDIFYLKGIDKDKVLAVLYLVASDSNDENAIETYRYQTGMKEAIFDKSSDVISRYNIMLVTALIYNKSFYSMAVNYMGAVSSGLAVQETEKKSIKVSAAEKEKVINFTPQYKGNIFAFPLKYKVALSMAAGLLAVFFLSILIMPEMFGLKGNINQDMIFGLGSGTNKEYNQFIRPSHLNIVSKSSNSGNTRQDISKLKQDIYKYTKEIRNNKSNENLYINRGIVYTKKGDLRHAIKDFNKAIDINPNSAAAYHNRAIANSCYKKYDFDKVIADLTIAVRLDPDNMESYFAMGALYYIKYNEDKNNIELYYKAEEMYKKSGEDWILDSLKK